jgi:hypothetical protein
MTQKSSLRPFFALAFLTLVVIICCLTSVSSAMIGGNYAYQSFSGGTQVAIVSTQVPSKEPVKTKAILPPTNATVPTETNAVTATLQASSTTKPTEKVEISVTPSLTATIIPTETFTPTFTATIPPTDTATSVPSPTANQVPTANPQAIAITQAAKATEQTQNMVNDIAKLYTDGIIHSTNGTFHVLPAFEGDWNKTDSIQKTDTGYNLADFVMKADISWEVDGLQGNWAESGCGVVIRDTEEGNYYLAFWSLDGRARLMRNLTSGQVLLGRSTIYDVDRNIGQAQVMVVAEGEWIRIFVNGTQKFEKRAESKAGKLEFTIVSGNPGGFGTYCKMSNVGLWEIK